MKVHVVVQDCLAYWTTEDEEENGWDVQVGDLDTDRVFEAIYASFEPAQQKVNELNQERKDSGATNDRWDFRVESIDVQN